MGIFFKEIRRIIKVAVGSCQRLTLTQLHEFEDDNSTCFFRCLFLRNKRTTYLIAGYVKQVAIVLERAPSKNAAEADRACGDESDFLLLVFRSLFLS